MISKGWSEEGVLEQRPRKCRSLPCRAPREETWQAEGTVSTQGGAECWRGGSQAENPQSGEAEGTAPSFEPPGVC